MMPYIKVKKIIQNWAKTIISIWFYSISTYFFIGKIIGTIPKECVEDAILIIKARNEEREQKKKEEEKKRKKEKIRKAEMERILERLENVLTALQKK